MNKLPENVSQGTFAEILVQLLLLKHGVQAAPPIKDSGNDLIAVSGKVFKAIQVKSSTNEKIEFDRNEDLPDLYHILALVRLDPKESMHNLSLDRCQVFLLPDEEVTKGYWTVEELSESDFELCPTHVDALFERPQAVEAA
jgi:hypothetical protein